MHDTQIQHVYCAQKSKYSGVFIFIYSFKIFLIHKMKTLYQLIFVYSLMVYKSYCTNTNTQSTPMDNNIARTWTKFVSEEIIEQELKSMSKFEKHRILARSRDYPYHAAILSKIDDSVFCQGVLIASNWMLTTGSCIHKYAEYVQFLHVVSGIENTWVRNVFISDIDYEIYHPQFHPRIEANDFALLKLITAVDDKDGFVKPIELSRTKYPIGTHCNYSTYDLALSRTHKHMYKLFGSDLNLLDLSNCDRIPDLPKQVMSYVCVGLDGFQFKTIDYRILDPIESEVFNITQVGSPLVCGNQLYGIKSKNDFFYTVNDIILWVNTVIHKGEHEVEPFKDDTSYGN